MKTEDLREAARIFAAAERSSVPIQSLPPRARPSSFLDAAAIQVETVKMLGERAAGYKVAGANTDSVMWGIVLASRLLESGARMPATMVPMLGIEAEIAFRVDADIPEHEASWTAEAFNSIVTALPAIEVVATRFASYDDTPRLDRAADFMSNGALICGEPQPDWDRFDLSSIAVTLSIGEKAVETVGGHPTNDPRIPALAFLNAAGRPAIPRGTIITTGAYAKLPARPGDLVEATFGSFGRVSVSLGGRD